MMRKRINKIGPLSCGLLYMALFAIFGLIAGLLMALVGAGVEDLPFPAAAAIIVLPLIYGIFGFIIGVITAFVYNLAAKIFGGIVLEFGDE